MKSDYEKYVRICIVLGETPLDKSDPDWVKDADRRFREYTDMSVTRRKDVYFP